MAWWPEILKMGAASAIGSGITIAIIKWSGGVFAEQIAAATRQRHTKELERLRSRLAGRLETAVYRSKAQFDVEFATLREIWKAVSETRRRFVHTRAGLHYYSEDEDLEETALGRANALVRAINELKPAIHDNEPFYPQEIFDALQLFVDLCERELSDLRQQDPNLRDPEWWTRAQSNAKEAERQTAEIATKIREHLKNVVIVE